MCVFQYHMTPTALVQARVRKRDNGGGVSKQHEKIRDVLYG